MSKPCAKFEGGPVHAVFTRNFGFEVISEMAKMASLWRIWRSEICHFGQKADESSLGAESPQGCAGWRPRLSEGS